MSPQGNGEQNLEAVGSRKEGGGSCDLQSAQGAGDRNGPYLLSGAVSLNGSGLVLAWLVLVGGSDRCWDWDSTTQCQREHQHARFTAGP